MFGAPEPRMENSRIRAVLAFARVVRDTSNTKDALTAANALLAGTLMDKEPEEVENAVRQIVERAEMIRSAGDQKSLFLSYIDEISLEDEAVAHFREGLGPDYRIMIDVWRTTDARLALSVARAIEKYNICWYEEPIGPDDLNVLRDIKMKTDLPLVAGEAMYGKRWFNEVCKLNCVDYINPDVSVVGGIAEMCDIAAIAEANYIKVGPHNCNSSTVSLNATIHAACTMPNLSSVETFPWHEEIGDKMAFNQIKVKDGYLELPDGPGLGIHMNEEFLESLDYSPRPPKTWKLFEEKI